MKERLKTFLFQVQGHRVLLAAVASSGLRPLVPGPLCEMAPDICWGVTGRPGWRGAVPGDPLFSAPHAPRAWPQPADPSLGSASEDGVYLPCLSPAGRALPIAEKATIQQKGFVRPGPQGKPARSIGFSPFVSRLKTWPSPPLSLKRPS